MFDLATAASDYKLIMIELTDRCNLNCSYCYRSKLNISGSLLSKEQFEQILDRIDKDAAILLCGMGEQFVHPEIYDFIAIAKERSVQLVSNGTILLDVERLFKSDNVQCITFSVDGPDEETMKQSCKGYKAEVLIKNLENMDKAKRCQVAINFVLGKDNLDTLVEMVDFAARYNVQALNFLLPTSDPKWVRDNLTVISCKLGEAMKHAADKAVSINLPDTMYCQYNGHIVPFISLKGYVRPCCSHDKGVSVVGNVLKSNMQDVLKSDAWTAFKNGNYCESCSMNKFKFKHLDL